MPRPKLETKIGNPPPQKLRTQGGNGGYQNRQRMIDTPNPQKRGKKPYDYRGNDARK